jgi:hypothetical protein
MMKKKSRRPPARKAKRGRKLPARPSRAGAKRKPSARKRNSKAGKAPKSGSQSKRARRAKPRPPSRSPVRRRREAAASATLASPWDARGLGPEAAGQSGDTEGLSRAELADSESVEELVEEGQAFEADVVDAVENAPDGEVRTREVPEDDVPEEYLDED